MDGSMDAWMGARSQLTCVILESQKQYSINLLYTQTFSLSHIHRTPLPLEEEQKGNRRVFFV